MSVVAVPGQFLGRCPCPEHSQRGAASGHRGRGLSSRRAGRVRRHPGVVLRHALRSGGVRSRPGCCLRPQQRLRRPGAVRTMTGKGDSVPGILTGTRRWSVRPDTHCGRGSRPSRPRIGTIRTSSEPIRRRTVGPDAAAPTCAPHTAALCPAHSLPPALPAPPVTGGCFAVVFQPAARV